MQHTGHLMDSEEVDRVCWLSERSAPFETHTHGASANIMNRTLPFLHFTILNVTLILNYIDFPRQFCHESENKTSSFQK